MIICRPQAGRYLRLRIKQEGYVVRSFEGEWQKLRLGYSMKVMLLEVLRGRQKLRLGCSRKVMLS